MPHVREVCLSVCYDFPIRCDLAYAGVNWSQSRGTFAETFPNCRGCGSTANWELKGPKWPGNELRCIEENSSDIAKRDSQRLQGCHAKVNRKGGLSKEKDMYNFSRNMDGVYGNGTMKKSIIIIETDSTRDAKLANFYLSIPLKLFLIFILSVEIAGSHLAVIYLIKW